MKSGWDYWWRFRRHRTADTATPASSAAAIAARVMAAIGEPSSSLLTGAPLLVDVVAFSGLIPAGKIIVTVSRNPGEVSPSAIVGVHASSRYGANRAVSTGAHPRLRVVSRGARN